MPTELIIDFGNRDQRDLLWQKLRLLAGRWRITLTEHRPRRSDRQNRFYWPCAVAPLGKFLRNCDMEIAGSLISDLQVHGLLKHKFLRQTVFSPVTGEVIGDTTLSTTQLTVPEFNTYLDRVMAYAQVEFDIDVPEPRVYREREETNHAARGAA
jgi:hypothetical protein